MAELLEKDDFCCETHIEKGGYKCLAYELECIDCLKSWLKEESK